MVTKESLIEKYELELHYYTAAYNVKNVLDIDNVADRNKSIAIRDFIEDLKKLPNESKTVNRNEQAKKYCPFCGSTDTKIKYEPVEKCNTCNKDWAI